MNTNTNQKPAMCCYCAEWFPNPLLSREHWVEVHKAEDDEFRRRRLERFGY